MKKESSASDVTNSDDTTSETHGSTMPNNDPPKEERESNEEPLGDEERESDEEEMLLFELDDSEDSDSSTTELLQSRTPRNRDFYKEKCLQAFNVLNVARIVMQRVTDCVGSIVSCGLYIWTFNYARCKPSNLRKKSSQCVGGFGYGVWHIFKLILDRKVFISVLLYGVIAILSIISNEVHNYIYECNW